MADNKLLIVNSIVKFLRNELTSGRLDDDCAESLEVAVQCIESAYGLNERQTSAVDDSTTDKEPLYYNLDDIFRNLRHSSTLSTNSQSVPTTNKLADEHKNRGNMLMQLDKYQEALEEYTKAIELYDKNAVYFCNRAAAYSKLEQHQLAVEDSKRAITLDPNYSKAYGRLGVAYSSLGRYDEARAAYQCALELEPDNTSYRNNLTLTEDIIRQGPKLAATSNTESQPGANIPGDVPFNLSGLENLNQFFANRNVVNIATQILENPEVRDMMQGVIQSNILDGASTLSSFVNAGQQLMEQLQNSNPDLIEQFRRATQDEEFGGINQTADDGTTAPSEPTTVQQNQSQTAPADTDPSSDEAKKNV